jgi:potassium efflux system protein
VCFFGGIAIPLALAALTIWGYYYTAQQLGWRAFTSVVMVLLLLMLGAFVKRLLIVHRRRLSIEQARLRRAARLNAESSEHEGQDLPEQTSLDATLSDLSVQTSQTRRLISTMIGGVAIVSFWMIWADVLPALDFLERWPVWSTISQITETITSESGDGQSRTRDIPVPTTVVDLMLAMLIAAMTLVAAQNLPGLLEISILQRLPLEASIRYAITTIASYIIMLLGTVAACHLLGLRWNQIQWMATALTFGLAFGLQEMFANFVAGVIILFERPIRVGDIVTVDEISGVVSRIRIRATTITDWDRKDFIVPNKDFITGRVLNWTLSDQVNRVVVNVGVAYGSDTAKAKEIMLRIAAEHTHIVEDPAPQAAFELFGDSSLAISLRCFIALRDMASRLKIIDEIHTAIDEQFKTAGIEIAFPQTDLHVRSFAPTVDIQPHAAGGATLLHKDATES